MKQMDWVGEAAQKEGAARSVRNMREAVAAEKAQLCLVLGELVNRIPPHIKGCASIQDVRAWRKDRDAAAKSLGGLRTSANELRGCISRMEPYFAKASASAS